MKQAPAEEILIVDEKDRIVGHRPRSEVDEKNLRYRVAALWLKNQKGESLLARRAYTKTHEPGRWGPAVSGTVPVGESYLDALLREAKEELGLSGLALKDGPKERIDGSHCCFNQWFTSTLDKPAEDIVIQREEVAEVKWFSKKELQKRIETDPEEFIGGMKKYCGLFA